MGAEQWTESFPKNCSLVHLFQRKYFCYFCIPQFFLKFEIYIFANNVETLHPGIYHYIVLDHAVELLKEGDFKKQINSAGLYQDMLGEAGMTIALTAVFDRTRSKYGERGMRYVYIEAGHISQNIALQSVSLGLGSVTVGAFYDEKLNQLLGLDGVTEATIYLHAVGRL